MDDLSDWRVAEERFRKRADGWALKRTIAIAFQRIGGNPVIEGCGVLLRIADAAFLLSAQHVLKEAQEAQVLLAPMTPGRNFVALGAKTVRLAGDPADVAIVRLPRETADALAEHGKQFLRLGELELGESPPQHGRYSIVGHPRETTRMDHDARRVDMLAFTHWTVPVERAPANAATGLTIALRLEHGQVRHPRGNMQRMPHWGGMSGCGIWRIHAGIEDVRQLARWDLSWVRLVGIEHSVTQTAVLGTFVRPIVEAIRSDHADLKRSIDLSLLS